MATLIVISNDKLDISCKICPWIQPILADNRGEQL